MDSIILDAERSACDAMLTTSYHAQCLLGKISRQNNRKSFMEIFTHCDLLPFLYD